MIDPARQQPSRAQYSCRSPIWALCIRWDCVAGTEFAESAVGDMTSRYGGDDGVHQPATAERRCLRWQYIEKVGVGSSTRGWAVGNKNPRLVIRPRRRGLAETRAACSVGHVNQVSSGPQTVRKRSKNSLAKPVSLIGDQRSDSRVSADQRPFSPDYTPISKRNRSFRFNV